ncbi:MAG: hypothetical protein J6Z02_02200 [Lachnospiraceae bacterium]|nr:hypothetical protein [Lachnospiraceae bacterium]
MIFIATAIELEARPFIEKLNLKKNTDHHLYNIYTGGDFALIVTGVGKIASAMAVTYMLNNYPAPDFFVNAGMAAGDEEVGVYLINSIKDLGSNRCVYPAMLYDINLPEKPLCSSDRVLSAEEVKNGYLYDMEGIGFFLAACKYLTNDRIILIKYISDNGMTDGNLSKERIESAIIKSSSEVAEKIKEFIMFKKEPRTTLVDKAKFDAFADYYLMSITSRHDLLKLLTYAEYLGRDPKHLLLINETVAKASRKQAGVRFIEELKNELLP